ncbi:transcription factor NF-E2 45 kDa subunit-like [Artemia franciscana]
MTTTYELKLKALNIPLSVDDVVNLERKELDKIMSKLQLTTSQVEMILTIRRRDKNKWCAFQYRSSQLRSIKQLAGEVKHLKLANAALRKERDELLTAKLKIRKQYNMLSDFIFKSLRNDKELAYSPDEYCLKQAPDGTVILVLNSEWESGNKKCENSKILCNEKLLGTNICLDAPELDRFELFNSASDSI